MGFLVQKAWTAPLPPKAEVVVVRGQRVARWTSRSGKVHTAEVLEGLSVGETVILHPSNAVRDGVRVKAR